MLVITAWSISSMRIRKSCTLLLSRVLTRGFICKHEGGEQVLAAFFFTDDVVDLARDFRPGSGLVLVPHGVDLDEHFLVSRYVVLGVNRRHRAGRLTSAAV